MGKHNAKKVGTAGVMLGGLLAVGAIASAAPALADTPATHSSTHTDRKAERKAAAKQARDTVRDAVRKATDRATEANNTRTAAADKARATADAQAATVGDAVRTVLDLGRQRPRTPYAQPGVCAIQVVGDSFFASKYVDGQVNPFAAASYNSALGVEYRKAFGVPAWAPESIEVCGNNQGCDGYVKGILNARLP